MLRISRKIVFCGLLLSCGSVWSQAKPYTLLVPFPVGGPADAVARMIQPPLREALESNIIVENVPGAGGSIGAARVLRTAPDGETIMLATIGETALTPLSNKSAQYTPEDFTLVMPLARSQLVLVSRLGLPQKNLVDLLEAAKAPGASPLSYATNGPGSIFHLASEAFLKRTGMQAVHVPYKGHAPVFADLMGEHIDLAFLPMAGTVVDMIKSGKVRALAISGGTRSAFAGCSDRPGSGGSR